MTSSDAPTRSAAIVPHGAGEPLWFLQNRMTIKVTAAMTGGAYGLFESLMPPAFSPPLHVHHREDEAFWILEGTLTLRCGDETFSGGPGTYVFLPRDVPHTFVVEGPGPARMLTLLSPGGGEAFFVAAGRPAGHDGFPPPGPPDIERLRQAATGFGMEILGPPMTPASSARAGA